MSNTNSIVPKNFGPPPTGIEDTDDDVLQGGRPSFAVLAMPNKNEWAFRYQRQDSPYQNDEGVNIPSIEVVIIRSRENISNNYYTKWDANAQHKAPDCWSSDGQVPDQRVPEATKQNPICEGCHQKKPGSALTAAGEPTKACRDIRKIAVIPIFHFMDRKFDEYGGPMLFTITPTSLKNYTEYVNRVKAMGHKTFSVVTRMKFDPDPSVKHQKIVFTPFRALSDDEFELAKEMRNDPRTANVLEQEPEAGSAAPDTWDNETGEVTPAPKPTPPKPTGERVTLKEPVRAAAPPQPSAGTKPGQPRTSEEIATRAETRQAPPPKPGGFAATSQTVNAAMTKPAPRPASVRLVQPAPVEEEEEPAEEGVEEAFDDGLNAELDDELKRLLANDE